MMHVPFLFLAFLAVGTSACPCTMPGVQCTTDCSPTFCLCDETLRGTLMNTSVGTRCRNGTLVYETQCIASTCETDGFYCTSPCSVTYSYCVSGRRTLTQFVPSGTVCNAGSLVYPTQCASTQVYCPTYNASIQCMEPSPCSPNFYYCIQYASYAVQMAPPGLKCYNNTFVLASDPVCTGSNNSQIFPILVNTQDWSILRQYEVATALSTALTHVGTPVQPVDIYFASVNGRRLASQQWMSIYSSYTNLSTALTTAMNGLPAILAENKLAVTIWLSPSASPSPSPSSTTGPIPLLVSGILAESISILSCTVLLISVIVF